MSPRERVLAEIIGSVRLEDAEPGREVREALDRWAAGELSDDELSSVAEQAAAGERSQLQPPAPPQAA